MSSHERSDDEAETKGHPDQAESACPLFLRSDISQHCSSGGCGSAAHTIDEASAEQQHQRQSGALGPVHAHGEGEQAQTQYRACNAGGDHGPAAEAITEGSDQWCGSKLRECVAAGQQT